MTVTSTKLGGLEVAFGDYACANETLAALEAGVPRDPRLVQLAGRHPSFVGSTPKERSIPLNIFILPSSKAARRAAFDTLDAAAGTGDLVRLEWTAEGVTRYYMVHCDGFIPDGWFNRCTSQAIASYPYPRT